ncbi:ribosomal RNA methyltransferase RrmJ/FtsJ [Gluconacetobacter diazotrophicus PA1 5]|uniref:Ribosomal RNA large subunit methyltransferase E n=2 Tax=Gluconacetobacter diazotrophicus TaxID=33996 RepID=A9HIS5_GLUDA|nr:RlmE family RNA methyltransferase [Gluconacetobacter diazotrophicus]ACI49892.1 ribosomal RNA methyltransferase RrmJ/FtsJ [Gluconacetobacter diazotrophicus PA1 5]MBB2156443.1 RlmE family RNA methyltransferase [Gluconacetobacter diazotrophicus]TWB05936.1 23S rRNA Um-2552 2'-O-methyltransferase [Gluconacetobacter diazotrophicus]CAP55808.1 putative ribosomal RNA large subunit methyltransferase J [Gluconacetobacter diazotrophicus PA1 5]
MKRRPPAGGGKKRVPGKALTSSTTPGGASAQADSGAAQSTRNQAVSLRTARGRTTAQQRWLNRQLNDPYVQAARKQGWRSRAAFKLIELDDRFHLIRPGMRVIDLGAAPGGWTQVAVKRGAAYVVGVDLLPVDPVAGATIIEGDFNDPDMPARLIDLLGGPADLVLSDMAPNTTGHAPTDHLRIIGLAELALDFAVKVLAPGGGFVAKVFQGGSEKQMLAPMKQAFATVRHAKPPASRKESSELYVVATGFRPERISQDDVEAP